MYSKGTSKEGVVLSYKGCPIHRIKKGGWIQGGDIVQMDGSSGAAALGGLVPDESFQYSPPSPRSRASLQESDNLKVLGTITVSTVVAHSVPRSFDRSGSAPLDSTWRALLHGK